MTYVITQSCCNDATCVAVCPVDCIHPTPGEPDFNRAEMLYIDPGACIDCGACADVCPVDAILAEDALTTTTDRYRAINAEYFAQHPRVEKVGARVRVPQRSGSAAMKRHSAGDPLRVAIVGSGPSGFYAAEELLARRDIAVEVTMIERMAFAGGLVRFGVAPDHWRTKAVERVFERITRRAGFNFFLDVEVGRDIMLDELLDHHHAVVYASGASGDRRMGIRGEGLAGCHAAREFVAWYNGHPEYADQTYDLSSRRAVIVGNGNVALDVARILVSDAGTLQHTDIADHALAALARSAVEEVVVLGRRGPQFAAYTTPELLALGSLRGIDVGVRAGAPAGTGAPSKLTILGEYGARIPTRGNKRITLRFDTSPVEVIGTDRVEGLRVTSTDTGEESTIECGLVIRSIGYQGQPISGLPFDAGTNTVVNEGGRVLDPTSGRTLPGRYVVGWIKRGPTGVIGTNRYCATETVNAIVADHRSGLLAAPTADAQALAALIRGRRPDALDAQAWRAIDRYERELGRRRGRPRVKTLDRAEIARVVSGVRLPGPADT